MIREYRNGDALKVLVQQAQADEAVEGAVCFDNVGKYSLVGTDGTILGVFGFTGKAGGKAECYAFIADNAGRHLLEAVRFFWREIPPIWRKSGYAGAQMTVKKGFVAGERFARMLGFEFAGDLPKFFNGNDYQLFERI